MTSSLTPGLIGLLRAGILVLPKTAKSAVDMANEITERRNASKARIEKAAAVRARKAEKRRKAAGYE
mgnify:FL=1